MPRPKPMSDWQADREYQGWTRGIVYVPVERFFGPAETINITVPARMLKPIDVHACADGETRSAFLTKAALEAIRRTWPGPHSNTAPEGPSASNWTLAWACYRSEQSL